MFCHINWWDHSSFSHDDSAHVSWHQCDLWSGSAQCGKSSWAHQLVFNSQPRFSWTLVKVWLGQPPKPVLRCCDWRIAYTTQATVGWGFAALQCSEELLPMSIYVWGRGYCGLAGGLRPPLLCASDVHRLRAELKPWRWRNCRSRRQQHPDCRKESIWMICCGWLILTLDLEDNKLLRHASRRIHVLWRSNAIRWVSTQWLCLRAVNVCRTSTCSIHVLVRTFMASRTVSDFFCISSN